MIAADTMWSQTSTGRSVRIIACWGQGGAPRIVRYQFTDGKRGRMSRTLPDFVAAFTPIEAPAVLPVTAGILLVEQ